MEKNDNLGIAKHCIDNYYRNIGNRGKYRFLIGLIARWIQYFKYKRAVSIARKRGAKIGDGVIMPISLAKNANKNLSIGNHVSIQTDKIDMRSPVSIGNYVIIGYGTEIITTSHNIDSPEWEHKYYGIKIDDYAWLPTNVMVLPSCRHIGFGAVAGSGSVLVRNIAAMTVVSGNPAVELKKRKCVHSHLVVESLLGGDFKIYKDVWKKKKFQL